MFMIEMNLFEKFNFSQFQNQIFETLIDVRNDTTKHHFLID